MGVLNRVTARAIVVAGVTAALSIHAAAQRPGRTSHGHPDLQGLWVNNTATPLERPREMGDRTAFTEQEATEYLKRYQLDRTVAISRDKDFELDAAGDLDTYEPGPLLPGRRSSLIVDPPNGLVPALTPGAQKSLSDRNQHLNTHYAENPEDLTNAERCLTVGNTAVPPLMPAFYNNTLQIVQTRDHVVIVSEMAHEARVVSLTRTTHLPATVRRWTGDSIGRWEGDTLVVETTNFTSKTPFRGSGPDLRVTERFSLGSDDVLKYAFTIEDPAFVRAWSAESAMTRTSDQMFEYACHEGNYSLPIILSGRRFAERQLK